MKGALPNLFETTFFSLLFSHNLVVDKWLGNYLF